MNDDMTKGVINRFKVMDLSRGSVLTGHVIVTTVRCLVACVAIIGVASAMGFDPAASGLERLGAIGLLVLLSLAAGRLTVALGLAAKTAESAGKATVPLIMLPFLSSAFVPADTMGAGVRQFAEYPPFTPVIEMLRGLLTGNPSSGDAIAALARCAGFAVLGYVWAVSTFKKRA
ncbi:ABC transporter permease [Streptomyces sp. NWU339]|uniref:ABC transporter permease n=1 Tax=Streptomyces sp. NWU339 TaxID=2185284 RepID=UPI00215A84D7|nr:ABC transporter permease [Streptomyces sp. NWU339]